MSGTFPITGIPLVPGQPLPNRLEITSWYDDENNKYQISLFMQAMRTFKERSIEDRLSFFQIAGIHSYPLVSWDGEDPAPPPVGNNPPGYCHHNLVTFPTWHRPYMLLYEKALYLIMEAIIDEWKAEDRFSSLIEEVLWRGAARTFRLPYWDWARKQNYTGNFAIPQVCTLTEVEVTMPGDETMTMPNPLAGFTNPKKIDGKPVAMGDKSAMGEYAIEDNGKGTEALPWSKCIGVSRFGINTDNPDSTWVNGVNDFEQVNAAMVDPLWYGQGSGSFSDVVGRLFTPSYSKSWETFASTIHNSPTALTATNFLSLEYIHNIVHNTTGGIYKNAAAAEESKRGYRGIGLGHMSDVPVAAFDPIFWFHHCNIDRLTAIWQKLNPTKWFDEPQDGDPLPTSALRPFHYDTEKSPWSSQKCKEISELNYQYDDLVPSPNALNPDGSVNEEKYYQELRDHIDELYPTTHNIVGTVPGFVDQDNKFNDYVINVIYDRYALNGRAYAILFFLGDASTNLSSYREDPNYIGIVYTFSSPTIGNDGAKGCENCTEQKEKKVLSKAQIPITLPLLAKAQGLYGRQPSEPGQAPLEPGWAPLLGPGLIDLKPDPVETVLADQLSWKFVEIGGTERPASDFPNTAIAVLYGKGQLPDRGAVRRDSAATYGRYTKLERATRNGRLGAGLPFALDHLIQNDP